MFLSSLFGRTRIEAKNAVAAINGYKELMEHLKKARNMTNQASLNAKQARKFQEEETVVIKYQKKYFCSYYICIILEIKITFTIVFGIQQIFKI